MLIFTRRLTVTVATTFCSAVFTGLTIAVIVFGFLRNILLFRVLVMCAQCLHNCMFNSILKTPVRFFDVNPIGTLKV